MGESLQAFSILERTFLLSAVLAGLAMLARLILLVGTDLDGGSEGHDLDTGEADHPDGGDGDGFQFLSLHGLSSFFLMFGLVGLALSRQSRVGTGPALLGALLAGGVTLWVIARLFRFVHRLQSSGTIPPGSAEGCLGVVCLTIPPNGTGRVSVCIGLRRREMDAIHEAGAEVPTGSTVRVVQVVRTVAIVQKVSTQELP